MIRQLPVIQRLLIHYIIVVQNSFPVDELTSFYMAEALTCEAI